MEDYSYLLVHDMAIEYLSNHLNNGSLTLFLGAGISAGIGLPNWPDLINTLILENNKATVKDYDPTSFVPVVTNLDSADKLQDEANKIERKINDINKFHNYLELALYPNSLDFDNVSTVISHNLLIALGAMMIGSKRGHVNNIVTLNYDNILEWYLSVYGYVTNVIYDLPKLEGNEDVRIFHPHGYIPNSKIDTQRSNFTIFSLDSVNERLGVQGDPWFEKIRHILRAGVCLFVGMSIRTFKDRSLAPLLYSVGKEVRGKRPLGFWILLEELDDDSRDDFLSKNIIPIEITKKEDVPKFLFDICKNSAKKVS